MFIYHNLVPWSHSGVALRYADNTCMITCLVTTQLCAIIIIIIIIMIIAFLSYYSIYMVEHIDVSKKNN